MSKDTQSSFDNIGLSFHQSNDIGLDKILSKDDQVNKMRGGRVAPTLIDGLTNLRRRHCCIVLCSSGDVSRRRSDEAMLYELWKEFQIYLDCVRCTDIYLFSTGGGNQRITSHTACVG